MAPKRKNPRKPVKNEEDNLLQRVCANKRERQRTKLANLQREIELKSMNRQAYIADICSMQYTTVNNLRTLSKQAAHLESEAGRVLSARHSILNLAGVPRVYLDSAGSEDEESSI